MSDIIADAQAQLTTFGEVSPNKMEALLSYAIWQHGEIDRLRSELEVAIDVIERSGVDYDEVVEQDD